MNFKVQGARSYNYAYFDNRDAADARARIMANLTNANATVFENVATFKPEPKPKMLSQDIDNMISVAGKDNGWLGDYVCAILNQLKKDGVKTLEYPIR